MDGTQDPVVNQGLWRAHGTLWWWPEGKAELATAPSPRPRVPAQSTLSLHPMRLWDTGQTGQEPRKEPLCSPDSRLATVGPLRSAWLQTPRAAAPPGRGGHVTPTDTGKAALQTLPRMASGLPRSGPQFPYRTRREAETATAGCRARCSPALWPWPDRARPPAQRQLGNQSLCRLGPGSGCSTAHSPRAPPPPSQGLVRKAAGPCPDLLGQLLTTRPTRS